MNKELIKEQIETEKQMSRIRQEHSLNMRKTADALIKCGYSKILIGNAFGIPELVWGSKK